MRKRGMRMSVETMVEIDLEEIINDLTASEKAVVAGLVGDRGSDDEEMYVRRAYDALMLNRPSEALAYLERHLFPGCNIINKPSTIRQDAA